MDQDGVEVHKLAKKGGQNPAILTEQAWSIKGKKPNTSRKSESIPFCLHDSQRGLHFHLYLDFLCPSTVTLQSRCTGISTGHVKIIKT